MLNILENAVLRSFQSLRKSIKFESLSGWKGWFTPARLSFASRFEFYTVATASGSDYRHDASVLIELSAFAVEIELVVKRLQTNSQ
jgi:hypothetical protein